MDIVLADIKLNPRDGFAWTSHSLRKGPTTAAYAIGVNMHQIRFFGGWATELSVVLAYIDPTVVPTTTDWYFFGWLTPWGGYPRNTRKTTTLWHNGAPHCFVSGHTTKSQRFEFARGDISKRYYDALQV
jgi:hypothetical protein